MERAPGKRTKSKKISVNPLYTRHQRSMNPYIQLITALLNSSSLPAQLLLCGRNHLVRFEPVLPLQFLERRRSPEGMHADDVTRGADVSFPPQCGGLLHGDARRHV